LLGGAASVFGPVIAAIALELSSNFLRGHLLTFYIGAMGLIVLLAVVFLPQRFAPLLRLPRASAPVRLSPVGLPAKF
jgi:branched-chain amino acid transport system permease protein